MFKCPKCHKAYETSIELLAHLIGEDECREHAIKLLAQHDMDLSDVSQEGELKKESEVKP